MKRLSLRWKVLGMVIILIVALSAVIAFYINGFVRVVFTKELQKRGIIFAKQASRESENPVINGDSASLYEICDRIKTAGDIDYAMVVDDGGNLLASTFKEDTQLPKRFVTANLIGKNDTLSIRTIIFKGVPYMDIAVPILGGELGTFRIGISLLRVKQEVNKILKSLFVIVIIVLLGGIAMAIIFANSIVNPIVHLTEVANKLSMGDFDVKIEVRSNDEIGELAKAIERMARSLKLAIERLRR